MTKKCTECDNEFETGKGNKATCSDGCKKIRKDRFKKASIDRRKEKFNCVYCNKEVFRYRKRGGFCSRTCASKKYIEDGTYDAWRFRIQEKKGIIKNCIECNKEFYAIPKFVISKKLCGSKECKKSYMSKYMKENSPLKGKKESPETREKVKKTLLERYGVLNAYELAKHTSLSKPQKEILEYLKKNTEYTIYSDFPIHKGSKCYKVDILIKELNLIIEFNGTYWHADPRFYKEDYLNKKKMKTAKEIWIEDELRIKNLKEMDYTVKVIWEFDYENSKQKILKEIVDVK